MDYDEHFNGLSIENTVFTTGKNEAYTLRGGGSEEIWPTRRQMAFQCMLALIAKKPVADILPRLAQDAVACVDCLIAKLEEK